MKRSLIILTMLASPLAAQADQVTAPFSGLPTDLGLQLQDSLNYAVANEPKSEKIPLFSSDSMSIILTLGDYTSRATGNICDGCKDFCRSYTVDVRYPDRLVLLNYAGERCIARPSSGPDKAPWIDRRPITLAETRWLVSAEDLAEAHRYLVILKYMAPSAASMPVSVVNALTEFRADALLPDVNARNITSADLVALRETLARSRQTASCLRGAAATACGRLN